MKISHENYNKMMEICTGKEINLYIYMCRFQNELGQVKGINKGYALQKICMKKSSFYKAMKGLHEKGLIRLKPEREHNFWDCTIVNNEFATKEDYKKGYVNINRSFLDSKWFYALNGSQKIILLNILKNSYNDNKVVKTTFQTMSTWIGKSARTAKANIENLKKVIKIDTDERSAYINMSDGTFERDDTPEKITYIEHMIRYEAFRIRDFDVSALEILDTAYLFRQYSNILSESKIWKFIKKSLSEHATVKAKYIHSLITKKIQKMKKRNR